MKMTAKISLALNVALLGSVMLMWRHNTSQALARQSISQVLPPNVQSSKAGVIAAPASQPAAPPFRWSHLMPSNNYQGFVANLRACGCPEPTVRDIVQGDIGRAFSWERSRLGTDGSGSGPWSQVQEKQLVATLLGNQPPESGAPAQNSGHLETAAGLQMAPTGSATAETTGDFTPLFLQNVDWGALGFTPAQQATIAQVRQQFQAETANLKQTANDGASQDPNTTGQTPGTADPAETGSGPRLNDNGNPPPTQWQQAVNDANQQLTSLLGAQAYAAYQQQQYLKWYTPQVIAAADSGKPLVINPDAFHPN